MGQLLTSIFETDKLEDVPIDKVHALGGQIVISECGEYAIIDLEGTVMLAYVSKVKFTVNNA